MANDVKVVIELTKASPRAGFGVPLILATSQTKAVAYTEVSSLTEVVTAGFAEATDVYKVAQLILMQENAPTKIAVCAGTGDAAATLPTILCEGWRQLVVVGDDDVSEVAAYIESCGKKALYFASVNPETDTEAITAIKDKKRTVAIAYESSDVTCPEAALVGATAGMDAGSITYKNVILKGVTAQTYTDAEVTAMHAKNVITILRKAGAVVTSEGITGSGEYIDIVDAEDYIIEQIEYQCQDLMNRVPKLPYDNRGIASLEGVVLSVLMDAANNGMIAQNEDGYMYTVTFGSRSDCAASDISSRQYMEGQFEFTLAGAIHSARITGSIIA